LAYRRRVSCAGEIVQVTGSRPLTGALHAGKSATAAGRLGPLLRQFRFPPLRSPGHPSTRTMRPLWAVRSGRPRRRTQRAASAISASAARGCPLSLCVTAVASGQSPTEPIQRAVQRRVPPTAAAHLQYAVKPGATGFVEVDAHYEPLASETGACKPVQRDTQWTSARYGTGRGRYSPAACLSAGHQLSGLPFGCPPLVDPPTPSAARARHPALVGHFLFSAKFICMGKQKNRLTATQRPRPHAPAGGNRAAPALFCPPRPPRTGTG
jgi:hypothetical protein